MPDFITKPLFALITAATTLCVSAAAALLPANFHLINQNQTPTDQAQSVLQQFASNGGHNTNTATGNNDSSEQAESEAEDNTAQTQPLQPVGVPLQEPVLEQTPTNKPSPQPDPGCPPCSEMPGHMICPMIACHVNDGSQF